MNHPSFFCFGKADSIVPATPENIKIAAALLHQEEICAFPTETVYGLGGNALSEAAIRRIYQMKGRPASNPLIVHLSDVDKVIQVAASFSDLAQELAHRFWPGPLTLVVPRLPSVPNIVSAGLSTVAIRVPAHPIAQQLLQACQLPICAPSANRSEQLSPTTAAHVHQSLPSLSFILDGGACRLGIESTVIDVTQNPPKLLRPGALPLLELRKLVPHLSMMSPTDPLSNELSYRSPGMMARHYAPQARLVLCNTSHQKDYYLFPKPWGVMIFDHLDIPTDSNTLIEKLPEDPIGYAADLYAALHRLDDGKVATIFVEMPPQTEPWVAIHDRLKRAATHSS